MAFLAIQWYKRYIADLVTKIKLYDELGAQCNLKEKKYFLRYLQMNSSLSGTVKQFYDEYTIVQKYFVLPKNTQASSTFYKLISNAIYGKCDNLRLV